MHAQLTATLILAIAPLGILTAADEANEAEEAAEALVAAEEHIAKGRYRRAISAYEKIARRWPKTKMSST